MGVVADESRYPTQVVSREYERANALTICPVCGGAAFGWLTLPDPSTNPTVGRLAEVDRVIDLCEECGAGVEREFDSVDAAAELRAATVEGEVPNRASWQAWIGGDSWSRLFGWTGHLLFTPKAVAGIETGKADAPKARTAAAYLAMWQTLINALTFNTNFASRVRAGELGPSKPGARGTAAFWVDAMVTVLASPLTGLAALVIESLALLFNRGGAIKVSSKN